MMKLAFPIFLAVAAGATAIGVDWGYHDSAELLAAGAVAVAARPTDVYDLMQAMMVRV